MIRPAVVAGQFYPGHRQGLQEFVANFVQPESADRDVIGLMSPHAGYVYSGRVAGQTFAGVAVPDEVILLGPNHTGRGHAVAVCADGSWETPLGRTTIAAGLAAQVLEECPQTRADDLAHRFEHSLEVQLPFLQAAAPTTSIVPICIASQPLDELLRIGDGIARVALAAKRRPLLVASSDMTHYESAEAAREKDFMALERVLALDPVGLYETVREYGITMCGVLPTVVMLQAAKALGASEAELVAYSNSGDVTGDQSEVVGYAGVRVF
jgi:AmmeMemoRadiSam system protein B